MPKYRKWLHGIICTLHTTANWKQSTHSYHSLNQTGNRISLLAVLTECDRFSRAAGTGMVISQYSVLSFQTRNDNSVLSLWTCRKFAHVFNGENPPYVTLLPRGPTASFPLTLRLLMSYIYICSTYSWCC